MAWNQYKPDVVHKMRRLVVVHLEVAVLECDMTAQGDFDDIGSRCQLGADC